MFNPDKIYSAPCVYTGSGIVFSHKADFEKISACHLIGEYNFKSRAAGVRSFAEFAKLYMIPTERECIEIIDSRLIMGRNHIMQLQVRFSFLDRPYNQQLQEEYEIAPDHFQLETRFIYGSLYQFEKDPISYGGFVTIDINRITPKGRDAIKNNFVNGEIWA